MRPFRLFLVPVLLAAAAAASGDHVLGWGPWKPATLASGQQVKVRPVVIDGRVREYTMGEYHQVTENLLVVRRVSRINDALPGKPVKTPQWAFEFAGWMSVTRSTGHIADLKLPEFDLESSDASWFQDYAAYCGSSDDRSVHYMVVFQLGKRKPVVKKELYGQSCPAPAWDKNPTRVTFQPVGGARVSFIVHNGTAELQAQ